LLNAYSSKKFHNVISSVHLEKMGVLRGMTQTALRNFSLPVFLKCLSFAGLPTELEFISNVELINITFNIL